MLNNLVRNIFAYFAIAVCNTHRTRELPRIERYLYMCSDLGTIHFVWVYNVHQAEHLSPSSPGCVTVVWYSVCVTLTLLTFLHSPVEIISCWPDISIVRCTFCGSQRFKSRWAYVRGPLTINHSEIEKSKPMNLKSVLTSSCQSYLSVFRLSTCHILHFPLWEHVMDVLLPATPFPRQRKKGRSLRVPAGQCFLKKVCCISDTDKLMIRLKYVIFCYGDKYYKYRLYQLLRLNFTFTLTLTQSYI